MSGSAKAARSDLIDVDQMPFDDEADQFISRIQHDFLDGKIAPVGVSPDRDPRIVRLAESNPIQPSKNF